MKILKTFKLTFCIFLIMLCVSSYGYKINILAYDADGRAEGAVDLLVYTDTGYQYLESIPFIEGKATFEAEKGKYMISMIYTETAFDYIKKIENIVLDQDLVLNVPFERGEIRVITGSRKAKVTLIHNKGETIDRYVFNDKETILVPPGDYTVISENPFTGKDFKMNIDIKDMKIVEIVLTQKEPGNVYNFYNRCPGCGKEFKGKGRFCINCSMPE